MSPATELAAYIAGFAIAEGTFIRSSNRFAFAVSLGAADHMMCLLLRDYFGVGRVRTYPRRRDHYDDEVVFSVQSLRDLVEVIVPFMDEHLRPSYKREQYDAWRAELLAHWESKAKRRRPCTVDGCDRPNRARGLCRHHYFQAFGA